jgi:hypothetical protein
MASGNKKYPKSGNWNQRNTLTFAFNTALLRTSLLILRTFAFIRRTSVFIPQPSVMDRATPKAL